MGRVIEIADRQAFISLHRGFMEVKIDKVHKAQIALSDIDILILNGTGATLSTNLLNELLENGTIILVLGKNYAPSGIFYPTNPHYGTVASLICFNFLLVLRRNFAYF